jgi:hypothetical protein
MPRSFLSQPPEYINLLRAGHPTAFQGFYFCQRELFLGRIQPLIPDLQQATELLEHSLLKTWIASLEITSINYAITYFSTMVDLCCSAYEQQGRNYLSPRQRGVLEVIRNESVKGLPVLESALGTFETADVGTWHLCRELFTGYYGRNKTVAQLQAETGLLELAIEVQLSKAMSLLHFILAGSSL